MTSNKSFEKLLEPGYIGKVRTRNRIIKTASGSGLIENDGTCGERIMGWYEAMAKGGAGLIIFETNSVEHPRGNHRPPSTSHLSDDKYIPSYTETVKRVHKHGCPFFIQLMHSGPWFAPNQGIEPGDRIAASAISTEELPGSAFIPTRGLSLAEVEEQIEIFVQAAVRAQKCGFDGVEVNGSHYHLINSFLSGFWNRRHDQYGGDSLENRARFMTTIIREIKKRCGQDYPVDTLINAVEYGLPQGGITLEEAKVFAQLLQEAGADSIQLRAAGFGEFNGILHLDRFFYPELLKDVTVPELDWSRQGKAVSVPLAAAIKQAVSIPVYVASRLDAELGEEFLRAGKLDFVGMTRRILADPEYPNKVAEGRLEDIAPCTGCLYCWETRGSNVPFKCRINAALGREYEYEIKPAEKKKKVLVAGGGPAGMEAARVAALRGHEVTLCEKEPRLGGLVPLAAMVKGFKLNNLLELVEYLKLQVKKTGVKVKLGTEVNDSVIKELQPDVLVVAVGGAYATLDIPGINRRKVVKSGDLHHQLKFFVKIFGVNLLAKLTKLWMPLGKRVVIIGGALHGCQLGEFLVKRGRKVTVIETAAKLCEGMLSDDPWRLSRWFARKSVVTMAGVKYEEITDQGLVVTTKEGERKTLEADNFAIALPLVQNNDLVKSLEGKVAETHNAGSCTRPGYIADAIADGAEVGHKI
ncbi:FAD-dependent oxidoreductase [Chloroflexota bacterium]